MSEQFKVGLFGIGLDTYWPQFPGLREKLVGSTQQVARKLEGFGPDPEEGFGGLGDVQRARRNITDHVKHKAGLRKHRDLRNTLRSAAKPAITLAAI